MDRPVFVESPPGFLDDFYVENATVHFEATGDSQFWIGVQAGGRSWRINCGAANPRAKGYSHIEED